jgi:hypothetical protein
VRRPGREISRGPQPAAAHHLGPDPSDRASQPLAHQLLRTKSAAEVVNRRAVRFPLTHGYEEAAGVLKITRLSHTGRRLTLKLEGEIVGPWVDAVRDACTKRGRRSGRVRLDLAAVTYADTAGVQLLRDLVGEGIEIAARSSFLAELLHLDD